MAVQDPRPKARYVAYQDLTADKVRTLREAVEASVPGIEQIAPGVFVMVHSPEKLEHFRVYCRLRSLNELCQISTVQYILYRMSKTYRKIKNSNSVFRWTLRKAEHATGEALERVETLARYPLVVRFVKFLDRQMLVTLTAVMENAPEVHTLYEDVLKNTEYYFRPCTNRIIAIKNCGTSTTRYMIKTILKCLPESLLPEIVDNRRAAANIQVPAGQNQGVNGNDSANGNSDGQGTTSGNEACESSENSHSDEAILNAAHASLPKNIPVAAGVSGISRAALNLPVAESEVKSSPIRSLRY